MKTIDEIIDECSKPPCQGSVGPCDKFGTRRRTNTSFEDEESNYVNMCDECFEIEQAHWADMWDEYYGSVL